MSVIRVALADDQALVLQGLRAVINDLEGIRVVIEAASGAALLDALGDTPADVVVSDVRMPGMDGLALCRELDAAGGPPVVLLTTFDEDGLVLEAAAAGAHGFMLKDASPEDLAEAIRRAAQGERCLQPVTTGALRERFAYHDEAPPTDTFTPREIAVLRLMAGGYSNREIAASLFLAEGTIKNYVSDILNKLATRDRTRAVLKAITLRII
ncbi:response regulator transcription factor [Wenzhouxiangella sp. XN24]|uniref:response regulator transcription factor n=1 Tax=Wenzhouxiangella sp. XN24 TaxID=2713569 RepID=UPI0013EC8651|nr:response regulator transcription factor [Wenzhouxiangella sp. XN24]NGX14864.1 response regulator transcription factor [Wenzhouxiangella sp. XN24]